MLLPFSLPEDCRNGASSAGASLTWRVALSNSDFDGIGKTVEML
jgi:hypothetical protein